jgi:hypothetical protein
LLALVHAKTAPRPTYRQDKCPEKVIQPVGLSFSANQAFARPRTGPFGFCTTLPLDVAHGDEDEEEVLDVQNLFVLEIATGETRLITDGTRDLWGPSFTPDGSSLVYTDPGGAFDGAEMRTVSVAGGQSTILFGGGHGGIGARG